MPGVEIKYLTQAKKLRTFVESGDIVEVRLVIQDVLDLESELGAKSLDFIAFINHSDEGNIEPAVIYQAAFDGKLDIVEELLKYSAENLKDNAKKILIMAINGGRIEVLSRLLACEAVVNNVTKKDYDALLLIARNRDELKVHTNTLEIVQKLLTDPRLSKYITQQVDSILPSDMVTSAVLQLSLDDLLVVASQVKFNPDASKALANIESEIDFEVMHDLKINNPSDFTLKDFILSRAKREPTQSIAEIMDFLDPEHQEKFQKIDRQNLLTNLIYAMQHGQLTIEEYGSFMSHFLTLELFYKNLETDPSKPVCKFETILESTLNVDGSRSLSYDTTSKLGRPINIFLGKSTLEGTILLKTIKIPNLDRYPKLQQALVVSITDDTAFIRAFLAQSHIAVADTSKMQQEDAYFFPIHILDSMYRGMADPTRGYETPRPVIGSYNYGIMAEYLCRSQTSRPVTVPSLLSKDVKSCFCGVRIDETDELHYDDRTKTYKDMTTAHQDNVNRGAASVFIHDLYHVNRDNKDDIILRTHIINALQSMLKENPKDTVLHKCFQEVCDEGVTGFSNYFKLCIGHSDKEVYAEKLKNVFVQLMSKLDDTDRNKLLDCIYSAEIYGALTKELYTRFKDFQTSSLQTPAHKMS